MKLILQEWWRSKKAVMILTIFMIASIVYIGLEQLTVVLIANCLSAPDNLTENLVILLGVCAVRMVLTPVKTLTRMMSTSRAFTDTQNRFIDKVLDADPDMFTKYSCSFINQMSDYVGDISYGGMTIAMFILDLANVATVLLSLYMVGGNVVIGVIIIYGIGAIIFRKLFSSYEKTSKTISALRRDRSQELENVINGFMEVRTFSTTEKHRKSLCEKNAKIMGFTRYRAKLNAVVNDSFEIIDTVGVTAVIVYAVKALAAGLITQAQGMSMVMFVFRVINPLSRVIDFVDDISQKLGHAKDYKKVISYENHLETDGKIKMDSFDQGIKLENVSFAYDSTSNVLKNVTMEIPKGKKIGICGESGCGKSTLFKLLNRFYDPKSGTITIDGTDIKSIDLDSFRQHVASVHQENVVFPGTIRDNILYGNENALEIEMVEACKRAHIYDMIMAMPKKFDTEVGPRGLTLSGGQRQRIALARLFLRNPEIILLDEATSALDNESETFVQDAIDELSGKTIVTIAHRLSTIRNSDIIYVMGNGGILEQGTHDELMALQGVYASMQK